MEYAEGHIAGAQSLPYDDAVSEARAARALQEGWASRIILYCGGGDCESSQDLAKLMVAERHPQGAGLHRRLPAWQAAGYPVEKGAAGAKR